MTDSIYSKYNIDPNKLSRDYINNPLKWGEKPIKEDLIYLYIELNLIQRTIRAIFDWKSTEKYLSYYNIIKPTTLLSKTLSSKRPTKHELYELYITKNMSAKEISSVYNPTHRSNRMVEKWLFYYNIKKSKRSRVNCQKRITIEKYGVENIFQRDDIIKVIMEKKDRTCLEKYGVKNYAQSREFKDKYKAIELKKHETMKKNNSFNKSKPEEDCCKRLIEKYGKANVIRQHRTELYPFNCDFYIKSEDLYIEYNGHWTHGSEPYDPNNKKHQLLLEKWTDKNTKFYRKAIEVWTVKDPLKRETAKKNNLNYREIWK